MGANVLEEFKNIFLFGGIFLIEGIFFQIGGNGAKCVSGI